MLRSAAAAAASSSEGQSQQGSSLPHSSFSSSTMRSFNVASRPSRGAGGSAASAASKERRTILQIIFLPLAIVGLLILYVSFYRNSKEGPIDSSQHRNLMPLMTTGVALSSLAGQKIADIRTNAESKAAVGAEPVTEADLASHQIMTRLASELVPVISEEGIEGPVSNLLSFIQDPDSPILFVDPLDATQEYTEGLTSFVSVSMCFTRCGAAVAGIMHFPFTDATYIALPDGTWGKHSSSQAAQQWLRALSRASFNWRPWSEQTCCGKTVPAHKLLGAPGSSSSSGSGSAGSLVTVGSGSGSGSMRGGSKLQPLSKGWLDGSKPLRIIVTRSHFKNETVSSTAVGTLSLKTTIERLQKRFPGTVVVKAGGAGFKLAAVLDEQADAYIHDGPIRMWDVCTGNVLVRNAGGQVTDWIGEHHNFCVAEEAAAAAGQTEGAAEASGSVTAAESKAKKKSAFAVKGIVASMHSGLHAELLKVIQGPL